MATSDKEQKDSQGVKQHHRMAMGAKLDGKTLPGTPVKTQSTPKQFMDDADLSQDRQEREDLIRARYPVDLTIPTSNVCLNCQDSTVNGARWCSVGCRQDYENRTNKK